MSAILPLRVSYDRREKQETDVGNVYRRQRARPAQTSYEWEKKWASSFDAYEPLKHNLDWYDVVRNGLPIIEATYTKYKMLVSEPIIDCYGNRNAQKIVDNFCKNVRVNSYGQGLYEWIIQLLDQALHFGNGWGEVVPTVGLNDIAYLKIAAAKRMRFLKGKDGDIELGQIGDNGFETVRFKDQDLIHHLAIWKRDGSPQGYSLLFSLPLVVNMLMRVLNSMQNQIITMGDPTFAIFIEMGEKRTQGEYQAAVKAISDLESDFDDVMEARFMGKQGAFFGAPPPDSKVVLHTLGSDMNLIKIEEPYWILVEQIIAATGFPLFFFYHPKNGTYTLTSHQSDMIVNQINFIRAMIEPIVEKVIAQLLLFHNILNAKFEITWPEVNLKDEKDQAEAMKARASAIKETLSAMYEALNYGLIQPESIVRYLVEMELEDERYLKSFDRDKMVQMIRQKYLIAKAIEINKNMWDRV